MASPLAKSWVWGQGQNSEIQHSAVICVLTDALVSALSPAALRLLLPGQQWYKGHGDGHHGAGQPSGDDPAAADALGGEIQGESLISHIPSSVCLELQGRTSYQRLQLWTNWVSDISNMTMIKEFYVIVI